MIHTDFEKGFIRAETIAFNDYTTLKGEAGAKEAGKFRLEARSTSCRTATCCTSGSPTEITHDRIAFEDFTPGAVIEGGPITVTRDELVAFAREFDPQPFHLDEAAAEATFVGQLIGSGWQTAASACGSSRGTCSGAPPPWARRASCSCAGYGRAAGRCPEPLGEG